MPLQDHIVTIRGGGSQGASPQRPAVLDHWTPHGRLRITIEVL